MARDPMGLMLKAIQDELTAVDDQTFKWSLKKPFRRCCSRSGKNNAPVAFIMPERIAKTDPFKQITEYVGSGPMKFAKAEWVPGAKAVFEKFADYVPRAGGGRRGSPAASAMMVDRVEWIDHAGRRHRRGGAAERRGRLVGEPDPRPRAAACKSNKNINVDIADPARQCRLVPHEPPASAVQQPEGAPGAC